MVCVSGFISKIYTSKNPLWGELHTTVDSAHLSRFLSVALIVNSELTTGGRAKTPAARAAGVAG